MSTERYAAALRKRLDAAIAARDYVLIEQLAREIVRLHAAQIERIVKMAEQR